MEELHESGRRHVNQANLCYFFFRCWQFPCTFSCSALIDSMSYWECFFASTRTSLRKCTYISLSNLQSSTRSFAFLLYDFRVSVSSLVGGKRFLIVDTTVAYGCCHQTSDFCRQRAAHIDVTALSLLETIMYQSMQYGWFCISQVQKRWFVILNLGWYFGFYFFSSSHFRAKIGGDKHSNKINLFLNSYCFHFLPWFQSSTTACHGISVFFLMSKREPWFQTILECTRNVYYNHHSKILCTINATTFLSTTNYSMHAHSLT